MTRDELLKKINDHEDNFVERKSEAVSPSELRQTVGAFANSVPEAREAVLFIGIHDKTGEVIGVGNTDQLQKRVRAVCHGDCFPPIEYASEVLTVGEKKVVAVVIPPSNAKPHFTGPAYVRVGSESPKATPQQYEELILSRVDDARAILKDKNKPFTVVGIGHKLGSKKPLPDKTYRETAECRVFACTGQFVTLDIVASGRRFSASLENVTVDYDHENHRPMLVVTFS